MSTQPDQTPLRAPALQTRYTTATVAEAPSLPAATLEALLADKPPGIEFSTSQLPGEGPEGHSQLRVPTLELFCPSKGCGGIRYFDGQTLEHLTLDTSWTHHRLLYHCRHCREWTKRYAVLVRLSGLRGEPGTAIKLGEWPPFSPHVPARLLGVVGPDAEMFNKGRRAESLGLGIGAFAYYRRVVERQKDRLLDQILKVAEKLQAPPATLDVLGRARNLPGFKAAVEEIKDAIPDVLRIDGHNPLTLLHKALSEGLHEDSDEDCLNRAQAVRLVLADLCDRMANVLREEKELKTALSRLLNPGQAECPAKAERNNNLINYG